jgi:hypothetical protein
MICFLVILGPLVKGSKKIKLIVPGHIGGQSLFHEAEHFQVRVYALSQLICSIVAQLLVLNE